MEKKSDVDAVFIDYLNEYRDKSLDELASILGISRATLYRRLGLLKKNGLVKKYGIKTWCIGYGVSIWFLLPLGVGINTNIMLSNGILRDTIDSVYVTYSPSRTIIVKHFYRNEEECMLINEAYTKLLSDYFEPIESISTNHIIIPRLYYGSKKVCIEVGNYNCPRLEFDGIDTIIVDGLIRGIDTINEISNRYHISVSTVRYHYREHVKRIIYTKVYVLRKQVNVIGEFVTNNIESLLKMLNILYANGTIDYIDSIYLINTTNPVVAYVEMHGNVINLLRDVEELFNVGLIDDAKIYSVFGRSY
ncbi:winged helix-turn-helix transcriptional regulator [Desulfurococcaceae archaeon MEX13E-LK6-19]|nr:winged helix-turn-helix transcriptional regulator [Desulfurococcaceae archaeon MEX13E-LK6-19]